MQRFRRSVGVTAIFLLLNLSGCGGDSASSPDERWVDAIQVKDRPWRAELCSDYLVTSACSGLKEFDDLGELPAVIRVGDVITYKNKAGKDFTLTVQNISVFTYSKDLDKVYGSVRYTAKKGDTTCTLYEERSRSKIVKTEGAWLSKIFVKNCREVASPEKTEAATKTELNDALRKYETAVGVFPKEFLQFSAVQQEAYIRGVLDGQYFLLETSKHPDRDGFVNCLNARLKTVLSEAKSFVEREGEQKYPMPWTLSRLVGQSCPKETRMQPKTSPKYTEASTSTKLVFLQKPNPNETEFQKEQGIIDKAFVRGVLDGKVFLLYSYSYPRLIQYLECLSKPDSLDAVFRGMRAHQLLAHNLKKSQAYNVAQAEALVCEKPMNR